MKGKIMDMKKTKSFWGICLIIYIFTSFCNVQCHASLDITIVDTSVNVINRTKEVDIKGKITSGKDHQVTLQITDPDDEHIIFKQVTSDDDGEFYFSIILNDYASTNWPKTGIYKVKIGGIGVGKSADMAFSYAKPSTVADILSFKVLGVDGKINGNNINLDMPNGTNINDIKNVIAIFTTSPNAEVKINETLQESGVTKNDFSNTLTYKLKSEDYNANKEYVVTINLPNNSAPYGTPKLSSTPSKTYTGVNVNQNPIVPDKGNDVFSDVPTDFWGITYIEALANKGIVAVADNKLFYPNNFITREEFVKLLVEAFIENDTTATTDFSDVSNDKWYYTYIATAVKEGIVYGIDNNKFGVGSLITRQDMAVMAYRVAQKVGISISDNLDNNELDKFTDESIISCYAKEAVGIMKKGNILSGKENKLFEPIANSTRAQAAKIICLLLQKYND
jgi:hypothetical protein